jgi:hypothetical protein
MLTHDFAQRFVELQQKQKIKSLERYRDTQKNLKEKEARIRNAILGLTNVAFQVEEGLFIINYPDN